jgi:hypothetical protein
MEEPKPSANGIGDLEHVFSLVNVPVSGGRADLEKAVGMIRILE